MTGRVGTIGMRRIALLLALGALGTPIGAGALLWFQDPARRADAPPTTGTSASPRSSGVPSTEPALPDDSVLLAWTAGGLPPGFVENALALPNVEAATEVGGDALELVASYDAEGAVVDRLPDDWAIPLDVLAFDPVAHAPFVTPAVAAVLADLGPDDAVLGATSSALRRLAEGGSLQLVDGRRLRVVAVVPDELVGGAEVVVAARPGAAVTTPRYALVQYTGPRSEIETRLRAALPEPSAIRFRSPAETPFLRHGDAVLPQALVKTYFGEFSYRRLADGRLQLDDGWSRENLVTEDLPVVGRTTCHRYVMPELRGALARLEAEGLGSLLPREDFGGCFAPRMAVNGHSISRHSWGIAIDLNSGELPSGFASEQDPRLVEVMLEHYFGSGADWLVPDPAHFEWVSLLC